MRRPAASARSLERIRAWRDVCPELTIRSTFIVGFPGETDADFEALLEFLTAAELDRVGGFAYSDVDGARSNSLPDHVPEDIKQERLARLMRHQADISARRLRRRIGEACDVLVDRNDDMGGVGRSRGDSPDVDGVVYVNGPGTEALQEGDFVRVRITAADTHDLFAEPIAAPV
jgi:ribosomal protein S12 methylthiotransferase